MNIALDYFPHIVLVCNLGYNQRHPDLNTLRLLELDNERKDPSLFKRFWSVDGSLSTSDVPQIGNGFVLRSYLH